MFYFFLSPSFYLKFAFSCLCCHIWAFYLPFLFTAFLEKWFNHSLYYFHFLSLVCIYLQTTVHLTLLIYLSFFICLFHILFNFWHFLLSLVLGIFNLVIFIPLSLVLASHFINNPVVQPWSSLYFLNLSSFLALSCYRSVFFLFTNLFFTLFDIPFNIFSSPFSSFSLSLTPFSSFSFLPFYFRLSSCFSLENVVFC